MLIPMRLPHKVCPIAPPGAQQYADQITGYVLGGSGSCSSSALWSPSGRLSPDGSWVEMIRQLKIAHDSAVTHRTAAIITIKAMIVHASDELRRETATKTGSPDTSVGGFGGRGGAKHAVPA